MKKTVYPNHTPGNANDLIERLERETGCRIGDNDGNNPAMAGLLGAVARIMGKTTYRERDDVAAGYLIAQQMTPEYQRMLASRDLATRLLKRGFSPDDVAYLLD